MSKQRNSFRRDRSIGSSRRRTRRFDLPELLERRLLLSAYTVSSPLDDGSVGTLRDAINQVNAGLFNEIDFSGPMTINLSSPLPNVTQTVTINGGSSPSVVLNGAGAGAAANGLELDGANSLVEGLAVESFTGNGLVVTGANTQVLNNLVSFNTGDGVDLSGNGDLLQGNLIGTAADGTETFDSLGNPIQGNRGKGVLVDGASNVTIGGTTAAARNVLSGNFLDGVAFANTQSLAMSGDVVEGNWIGLGLGAANGTAAGNLGDGVDLGTVKGYAVTGVLVGGTAPGTGNVISDNLGEGIYLNNSSNNLVEGNLIGTDAAGNADLNSSGFSLFPNAGDGIFLDVGASGNTFGGVGAGNIIAGNNGNGVSVQTGPVSVPNVFEGNTIGVDAFGLLDGNGADGMFIVSGSVVIGGSAPGQGNVISAQFGHGLSLFAGGTVVQGNSIGANSTGTVNWGCAQDGIFISSSGNVIGGAAAGQSNLIAFNGAGGTGAGVDVNSGTANAIRGNSIFSNATLGITLGADGVGVVLNDSNAHSGPNDFQNFPVITSVTGTPSAVTIAGTFTAAYEPAGSTFNLDFFANTSGDGSGYGQGMTYLGSATVTTDASGAASFSVTFSNVPAGQNVFSATATDANGNTSEFGQDVVGAIINQSGTTTTLTSSASQSTLGQPVTFTATVNGGTVLPTGSVTFSYTLNNVTTVLGTVALATNSNIVSLTTAALGVGQFTITAIYGGDSNYTGSSAAITQTVGRASTSTSLSSSANPSTFGQSVTLTAVVSAAVLGFTPTGTVMFLDGSSVLGTVNLDGAGTGVLTLSTLSVGTHTITAVYNSDSNFMASTSPALTQTVNAAPSSISGHVFFDVTGDGLSADDKTMAGVKIELFRDSNGNGTLDGSDVLVATAVSDNNGAYSFANLAPATYFVEEVTPAGYVRTAPTTSAFYANVVVSGSSFTHDDFDNFQTDNCSNEVKNVKFIIDGCKVVTNLRGQVHQGDTVTAQFTVTSGHTDMFSLVSYTAPGSSFNANDASEQKIYQDSSGVFGPGTHTLTVVVPRCYFQIDFVCGAAIDQFGPAGSNIFYSAEQRLISADNGGTNPPPSH